MKTLLLALLTLAALAACDQRAALVEKCVTASVNDGLAEGMARARCMRSAYGAENH